MQDSKARTDIARLADLSGIEMKRLEADLGGLLGGGEDASDPDRVWAMGQEVELMAGCYLYGPEAALLMASALRCTAREMRRVKAIGEAARAWRRIGV